MTDDDDAPAARTERLGPSFTRRGAQQHNERLTASEYERQGDCCTVRSALWCRKRTTAMQPSRGMESCDIVLRNGRRARRGGSRRAPRALAEKLKIPVHLIRQNSRLHQQKLKCSVRRDGTVLQRYGRHAADFSADKLKDFGRPSARRSSRINGDRHGH